MHSNCCAIFPTWPKCPARWLRTQMYISYAREVRSSMYWLIGPQSSIMLCEQQVLGETWRWPRRYMTLTHTDQRWQHEYLVRWVIVFAVQFQFQQSCFAEQTAFALRLQFSNAKWSLIVQHFFQNFVFAGTASGNQDVSATEGSVNKYTHMVLKKKASCTSVVASSTCLPHNVRCFFIAFCDGSKQAFEAAHLQLPWKWISTHVQTYSSDALTTSRWWGYLKCAA